MLQHEITDQVQIKMQEGITTQSRELQQTQWPCSVTVFGSTAGSFVSHTLTVVCAITAAALASFFTQEETKSYMTEQSVV